MRKIIVTLVIILIATGVAIAMARIFEFTLPGRKLSSLLHIYGGLFFLVLFPLYAWDHVNAHSDWLRRVTGITISGGLQLLSAAVLILSGVLILIYWEHTWNWARQAHHWLTYLLGAALALHYLSPKNLPPR
ncbi:MAG: hypothetical protein OEZ59_00515 [Deltaproteobacteria bacterium]|nr:hypothetical protein [Deltaproteobacteria bacterium]